MTEDFGQISLNLDTSFKPFTKKKVEKVQVHGNRRSRIKQRQEIKRNEADNKSKVKDVKDNNDSPKKPSEQKKVYKKRKHDETESGGPTTGGQRFGKQRKTDGIISSLFKNNPEIPRVDNFKVEVNVEEVFAGNTFKELPLHPHLVSNLEEKLGFTSLTQIQKNAIPVLLKHKDALIKSQTGSGKTLAYAVPIIQSIQAFPTKTKREDGPYALVIVPTRELVLQTYDLFVKLLRSFIWIVPGCLMGGEKRKAEKSRLRKGVNILVTTPGRLLDHINSTNVLSLARIHWLVIDEADRLLELGYERDVAQILNALKAQCPQHTTVLLSATLSEGVERLSSITLTDPEHISINATDSWAQAKGNVPAINNGNGIAKTSGIDIDGVEESSMQQGFSVPSQLNQFFIVTPCKLRLVTLASWILWKCRYSPASSKMIVFMSTQDMVEFHWQLFKTILNRQPSEKKMLAASTGYNSQPDAAKKKVVQYVVKNVSNLSFFQLHGEMKQKERTETFHKFSQASGGILLCTDVAARGLDLPHVDWIVQYTLPGQTVDYIHRIGRTARAGTQGQSLLFLMPSEVDYVKELNNNNLNLSQMGSSKMLNNLLAHIKDFQTQQKTETSRQMPKTQEEAATFLQDRFEEVLRKDTDLHKVAAKGFQSYVRAYSTYSKEVKAILKARELHLGHVAKSFGLREAPSEVHGISAKDRAEARKYKKESKKKSYRPMTFQQAALSEYSSGFTNTKRKY